MSWFPRGYFADLEVIAAIEGGRKGGLEGGFKGGRPSPKPPDAELDVLDALFCYVFESEREARAELVKELAEHCGVTRQAARGWLAKRK